MPRRLAALAAALLAAALLAAPASAQRAYGRLDGDLTLEVALGGGVTFDGDTISGAGTLEARARYLDAAGVMIGADVRPDREAMGGGGSRVLLMVDVRPVWLPRFFLGASVGDRYVDVLIDSIGIDLGVALTPLDSQIGAAFAVGFGLDVPLVFFGEGYEGLSLRVHARHVASLETDRLGPTGARNDWIAGAALVLRLQSSTGLTTWERRRYETRPR